MAIGSRKKGFNRIVEAISDAERGTTSEVYVHISRRWVEPNPYRHAVQLFFQYEMDKRPQKNAILFYINLQRRKLAVIGGPEVHHAVGPKYWLELVQSLQSNLKTKSFEDAIIEALQKVAQVLRVHFPQEHCLRKQG